MKKMEEFLAEYGIKASSTTQVGANPNMDDGAEMDHWRVTLTKPGAKRMTVYFSMGAGHNGKAPEVGEVLNCLALDSSGIENNPSFSEWANEYGYDTDSRKAHRTYTLCQRQQERLYRFLGEDAYKNLLYHTEAL